MLEHYYVKPSTIDRIRDSWLWQQCAEFFDRPDVICYPCFHRWRHAQRLMNPTKVVEHEVQRDRTSMHCQVFSASIVEYFMLAFTLILLYYASMVKKKGCLHGER